MAGFEVVVRPVVFPNIRPAPPRILPQEDNPEQGIAVLTGGSGGTVTFSRSWSVSLSRQMQRETTRTFDRERVYQMDKDGNINKDNFVDVERLSHLEMDTPQGPLDITYSDPPKVDNVEIIDKNVTR